MPPQYTRIFGSTGRAVASVGQGTWRADETAAARLRLSDEELVRIDAAFPRGRPRRGLPMI